MQIVNTKKLKIELSPQDIPRCLEILQGECVTLKAEQFNADSYLDSIVKKPWGWEYRIYADNFYDMWKLSLLPRQATSLHCHPRKETALLCLSGTGKMSSLERTYPVSPMDIIHIGKGVFHTTENVGDSLLELIEVETPRNKLDLVRSMDKYGRKGKNYEQPDPDRGIHVIKDGALIQGSKLRNTCIDNRYRFNIRAGMDIICNPGEQSLFIVSLDVTDAIAHNIHVFPGNAIDPTTLNPEGLYFTISQAGKQSIYHGSTITTATENTIRYSQ